MDQEEVNYLDGATRLEKNPLSNIKDLIIVPCHASFKAEVDIVPVDLGSDANWALFDYQKGEVKFYLEHISKAIEMLEDNKGSLVVFSGSCTRVDGGEWSEAETYHRIALTECFRRWGMSDPSKYNEITSRMRKDVWALDSFENMLGSLCEFKNAIGDNPRHVTVVGWKFKEERIKIHMDALKFPMERFSYVGVNNPIDMGGAIKGEARAISQFENNIYGAGGNLGEKRRNRNRGGKTNCFEELVPEMTGFIEYMYNPENGNTPYNGDVDWESGL
ncbi:MAG: hypothetical protein M3P33_00425 [bacterium]|nr:hypothetical protein [bacterium]